MGDSPLGHGVSPPVLVVMGPAGSGKSTLGLALATELDVAFLEGDALHSPESVAKMRDGQPLTDEDRWPWLERIRSWIDARIAAGEGGVVASSALRHAYRDVLLHGHDRLDPPAAELPSGLALAGTSSSASHVLK